MFNPMTNDEYLATARDNWEITSDGYRVYSPVIERYFTGSTLTIARANRATAERVCREHHTKEQNMDDDNAVGIVPGVTMCKYCGDHATTARYPLNLCAICAQAFDREHHAKNEAN